MPDIYDRYESQHAARIKRLNQMVKDIYNSSINEITIVAGRMTYNGKPFSLSQYPALQRKVDQVLSTMQAKIYATIVSGINEAWADSNTKNNIIVDRRLGPGKKKIPGQLIKLWYDPNLS